MKKILTFILLIVLIGGTVFLLRTKKEEPVAMAETTPPTTVKEIVEEEVEEEVEAEVEIFEEPDWFEIKPDESGKIMVVMFHNFVETFTETKYDKGEYTMTFDAFRELLLYLYEKDYRPISFEDFIRGHIDVAPGKIPIVFTFDDGTAGQFHLEEKDGELSLARDCAVGVMEEFTREYPDFPMKGIFFINMGSDTFRGAGTKGERLKYLTDLGLEIGNHTYNHADLTQIETREKLQEEVGKNQMAVYEALPGYEMIAFSLPYGNPAKDLKEYVIRGEYKDVKYENLAILEVGWNPSYSAMNVNFNPYSVSRVRSPGMEAVQFDLYWWVENTKRSDEYVSDGNPDTIAIPAVRLQEIDRDRLGDKKLIIWDE